jgi:hypothetical protein
MGPEATPAFQQLEQLEESESGLVVKVAERSLSAYS